MSIFKKASKALKKTVKSVKNVTKSVTNSVGKIASGKVGEGLSDLGQTAARSGLDIATGGNKSIVDNYSGGLLTSAENAARGNTKDIARLGVTGGATLAGGPAAGFAVNNVYGAGGNTLQAGLAGFSNGTFGGSDMSFLTDAQNFLGSNNPLAKLANDAIAGVSFSNKPKPMPQVIQASAPTAYQEDNTKKYMLIGGGALALVLVLVLVLRRKK